jgi:hypothetical protein
MSSSAPTSKPEHQNTFDNLFKTCIIQQALQAVTVAGTGFEFNYTHELSHLTELCLQQGGHTNHGASFRFTLTVFMGVQETQEKQQQTLPVAAALWVRSICDMLSVCGFCSHSETLQAN